MPLAPCTSRCSAKNVVPFDRAHTLTQYMRSAMLHVVWWIRKRSAPCMRVCVCDEFTVSCGSQSARWLGWTTDLGKVARSRTHFRTLQIVHSLSISLFLLPCMWICCSTAICNISWLRLRFHSLFVRKVSGVSSLVRSGRCTVFVRNLRWDSVVAVDMAESSAFALMNVRWSSLAGGKMHFHLLLH